ncbi:glycosyltransferase family 2 protein [Magnetococcus sp. PR-3]|uniref:glycosyltransferase family 2 protein n=1 Tax=Magnetococcus sp. PR-3 TaxID=3120355 RepID=UPI002FCE4558
MNSLTDPSPRKENPVISVVFSFRNEESNIPTVLKRLDDTFAPLACDYELIFVNDDSTDNSLALLEQANKENSRIKVVNMSRRWGVAECVMAGFSYTQGDAVVYMDTDLQDPPELIPQMIEKWRSGADVVNTTRLKRHGEGRFKLWATKKAYQIINYFSDVEIPMNTGDFKLLDRRVIDKLLELKEDDPFMRGLVRWVGYRQEVIYYDRDARFSGETHFPVFSRNPIRAFVNGIVSFSSIPLYFSLFMGMLVSASAFLYLFYIIITRLFFDMHLPGWPAIMATVLFLGGLILFTIGIQGLYVARIYRQVKERPLYIVQDTLGIDKKA